MKQFWRIVLVLGLVLLISSGLVRAQDTLQTFCGDLSQDDCALVKDSKAVMQALDSRSFKLDMAMSLTGIPNIPSDKFNFHLTGSGTTTVDHKSMPDMTKLDPTKFADQKAMLNLLVDLLPKIGADMQFTLAIPPELQKISGSTKLPESIKLSLRMVDGVFYVKTGDLAMFMPQGKSPADWMGINLPDLITAVLKRPELSANMGMMGSSMNMGSDWAKMFSDPKVLGSFLKIERLADAEVDSHKVAVFKTTLDYAAMFAQPGMQELLMQQQTAMGNKMSENETKMMMDMIQKMAKGMHFSLAESIDLESKYVHQTTMNLVVDMSSLKAEIGSALIITVDITVNQGDFNAAPAITAPKDGVVIPVESILPSK